MEVGGEEDYIPIATLTQLASPAPFYKAQGQIKLPAYALRNWVRWRLCVRYIARVKTREVPRLVRGRCGNAGTTSSAG